MAVTAQDVASFLGQGDDDTVVVLAGEALPIVVAMAKGYTRGNGWDDAGEPAEDLVAVVTTPTARMASNPSQLAHDVGEVSVRGGFVGWSLAETFVLNRYCRRAL